MKRIVLIVPLVFFLLGVCGLGWGEETFVVLGKSERGDDLPHPTLEMAVKDGLRKAVEEAVRGMITFQAMEEQHKILVEGVYNRAESFVLSYKVLEETPLSTGYQALLEVLVDTKGIKKSLESLGLLGRGEERPLLRKVKLVVAGIKSYRVYLKVEEFLKEDVEVSTFALTEIEPTKFTWGLVLKGETGRLADKILHQEFGGLKVKVITLTPEELEIELSTQGPSKQGGGG
ncbi:MAG: hypothetical protein JRI46_03355 [Deltaproteobacteria bacterium]|nr:hypothetical protein [Deltaproteobacteria bacterium]